MKGAARRATAAAPFRFSGAADKSPGTQAARHATSAARLAPDAARREQAVRPYRQYTENYVFRIPRLVRTDRTGRP